MYELSVDQIECVNGGSKLKLLKQIGKWVAETAAGEALIEGAKALAQGVSEAGGPSTGGYGENYHSNLPPGMQ